MPQRKFRKSKGFLALAIVFPLLWGGSSVFAETSINATVCGSDAQSTISIESPKSDTIVGTTNVTVAGSVTHSNQVEVYLDDQYDQTVALRPNQTDYRLTVQTTTGTHILRVEAIGVCGGTATAQSIFTIPEIVPTDTPSSPTEDTEEEIITSLDGVAVPPLEVQDTEKFFAEAGLDKVGLPLRRDAEQQPAFTAQIAQTVQQYASTAVFAVSVAAVALAVVPAHAGAAMSVLGVPRRLLIVLAVVGGISALFLGI